MPRTGFDFDVITGPATRPAPKPPQKPATTPVNPPRPTEK